jgi:DNA-binding HxlR family transcriptional regulator
MRSHLTERSCSVGRTIDVIGDGWSFMILRECYFGATRFEQFQKILGLPRTTLSNRLQRLVKYGLLNAQLYMRSPPRREYRLSESGKALYPVLLSLMTFGDRWLSGADGKPLQLTHTVCEAPCSAIVVCPHCRKKLQPVTSAIGMALGLVSFPCP